MVLWSDLPVFKSPLYVSGISRYHVNWEGMVYKHEVSNIAINGVDKEAPYINFLDLSWLTQNEGYPPGVAIPGMPSYIKTNPS